MSNSNSSLPWLIFQVFLCCGCLVSGAFCQKSGPVGQRIRDLIITAHPELATSGYRLSLTGQMIIGLKHPVADWFVSVEPYPVAPGLRYVYGQTSTPCEPNEHFLEGTCVLPSQAPSKRIVEGRATLGTRGQVAVEMSRPDVTERDSKIKSSLPDSPSRGLVDKLLVEAGAKFPPSKRASFVSFMKNSQLLAYLNTKSFDNLKFCILQRVPSKANATRKAVYWEVKLHSAQGMYLATMEPLEGDLTSLLPLRGQTRFQQEQCIEE